MTAPIRLVQLTGGSSFKLAIVVESSRAPGRLRVRTYSHASRRWGRLRLVAETEVADPIPEALGAVQRRVLQAALTDGAALGASLRTGQASAPHDARVVVASTPTPDPEEPRASEEVAGGRIARLVRGQRRFCVALVLGPAPSALDPASPARLRVRIYSHRARGWNPPITVHASSVEDLSDAPLTPGQLTVLSDAVADARGVHPGPAGRQGRLPRRTVMHTEERLGQAGVPTTSYPGATLEVESREEER